MKWRRAGKKDKGDLVDIRGAEPPSGGGRGGGMGGLPIPAGAGGIGGGLGLVILLVVLGLQMCGDGDGGGGFSLDDILGPGAAAPSADQSQPLPPGEDPQEELAAFSHSVFSDAQNVWDESFTSAGQKWEDAQVVLYRQAVNTGGCGSATSAVGPFYCPADQRVYLDLSFYEDMERQLNAPGDFAWAYVIAHEVGHHVQNVDGTNAEVTDIQRSEPDEANDLSVRLELQADCYAGVWAATQFAEGDLEEGDLDEAFTAAEAVGDDRLQEQAGQKINPDSFTHGSSEQRRSWFNKGYSGADPASCDTFSPDEV